MSRPALVAFKQSAALAVAFVGLGVFASAPAQAHFKLVAPTSWWTQANDGSPQKSAPCGNETTTGTMASKVVNNVQAGQTVSVQVMATIAHPGWWRISLKQGASSTQTATSLPDPAVLGASGSAQQCTPAFIDNPVWSTTQPVLADKLGIPAGSTSTTTNQSGTQTFTVTIPSNATCTTAAPCTLQVMMFMTDHPAGMCNYHHCADIAVGTGTGSGGAGGAGGATGTGGRGGAGGGRGGAGGTTGAGGGAGATSTGGTTGSGGSSVTGSGGTPGTGGSGTTGTGGSGTTGSGGTSTTGTGGSGTTGSGGTSTAGAAGTTGSGSGGNSGGSGGSDSGGGCAVGGAAGSLPALLLMIAVVFGRRRRRR